MQPLHNPLFVKFIVYFNENQDYFECHEVLEEYWKSLPGSTKEHPLTAYILLSTGLYHFRRNNKSGALRTLQKAYVKMTSPSHEYAEFTNGIDFTRLCDNLKQTIGNLNDGMQFQSFPLVIISQDLEILVKEMIDSMTLLPPGSDDVIHKHMLRDRSDILQLREEKKKDRN